MHYVGAMTCAFTEGFRAVNACLRGCGYTAQTLKMASSDSSNMLRK